MDSPSSLLLQSRNDQCIGTYVVDWIWCFPWWRRTIGRESITPRVPGTLGKSHHPTHEESKKQPVLYFLFLFCFCLWLSGGLPWLTLSLDFFFQRNRMTQVEMSYKRKEKREKNYFFLYERLIKKKALWFYLSVKFTN